jgi:phospholipid/cholesterol/gamma-HCH transport system substrate-binding protein
MKRNIVETIIGAIVLVVAVGFFAFAYTRTDGGTVSGYEIVAEFTGVGALAPGADVRISGIKVGSVLRQELDPETFMARVVISIDDRVELPSDTSASIGMEGLLGGAFIALEPGGDIEMLGNGGMILFTESALDLASIIRQVVLSPKDGS